MTILLGKSPIGIAIVSDKGGTTNINNQDRYITENGVYTADEGYTGLGTVEVNVESSIDGETIEVLNKTGAVINQGDKVWINKNGNNYELVSYLKNIVFGSNTVVGSPTINQSTGIANNFSTSNYIETIKFQPQTKNFDIHLKIRTANDVSTLQLFLGNGGYYDRCWGGIDGGHFLWNLNDTDSFSTGIGTITGSYNVLPNTDYYIHLSFNGTQYILEYSLDGINYVLDGIINSSTNISDVDYPLTLGANHYIYDVNYPFFGDIDLTQCSIDIDNKRCWCGATAELNINDDSQTGFALENIATGNTGLVNIGAKLSEESVGDEIEVINNTGRTIEVGDKVWVNILSDNVDGSLQYSSYNAQFEGNGFTKDGQYLFAGFSLYKVNADNSLTQIKRYNANNPISIKHFNGKTYAVSSNFTACINYPNNWDVGYALINDGYFVNYNSTEIRKYDLDTGELIKTYTGDYITYPERTIVIDNVMYYLSYERRKYTFDDINNTYSAQDYVVAINNTDNKEIGTILGKTSDSKYYIDSNLNLIRYLGNDTFEVVAYEKMSAILQHWNGMNKSVNFNQDTGVLVVDAETEYGIYKYDNGEWQKLNYELNRNISDSMKGSMAVNYDLTKYAFTTSNGNSYRVNVGTMQPNLKVMAQEFRWFNVNERTITGVAKTSAEPDEKFTISTILEPEIEVTITTNADNAEILMEL